MLRLPQPLDNTRPWTASAPPTSDSWSPAAARAVDGPPLLHGPLRSIVSPEEIKHKKGMVSELLFGFICMNDADIDYEDKRAVATTRQPDHNIKSIFSHFQLMKLFNVLNIINI